MNVPYSIHRFGQTAREMNTQQYIDWDQRRQAMARESDRFDAFIMSGSVTANWSAARLWTSIINGHCHPDKGTADPSLRTYSVY